MVYANKAQYVGAWQKDMQHGYGVMIYVDGRRYEGTWQADQKHDPGVIMYANGRRCEEMWKNGRKEFSCIIAGLFQELMYIYVRFICVEVLFIRCIKY